MASFVVLGAARGSAAPPIEVGTVGEVTRSGDAISQEIYAELTAPPVSHTVRKKDWAQLIQSLATPDRMASCEAKLVDQLTAGRKSDHKRHLAAKNACCLILKSAGLTVEQIALAFNHPKGHVSRLIENAAQQFAARRAAQGQPLPGNPLEALSTRPRLTFRDRDNLNRQALRWARSALSRPQEEREFLIPRILDLLGHPPASRHEPPKRPEARSCGPDRTSRPTTAGKTASRRP